MPHPQGFLMRAVRGIPAKARKSLYAGKQVSVINRVSKEYEIRSPRLHKPNVVNVRLFSQALNCKVKLNVTTTALRAIDRAGGLDRYLWKTPDSLLHSDIGSDLKFRISLIMRNRMAQAAAASRQQQQLPSLPAAGGSQVGSTATAGARAAAAAAAAAAARSLPSADATTVQRQVPGTL